MSRKDCARLIVGCVPAKFSLYGGADLFDRLGYRFLMSRKDCCGNWSGYGGAVFLKFFWFFVSIWEP